MNSAQKYLCKFFLVGAASVFVCRYLAGMEGGKEVVQNLKKYFEHFANSNFAQSNKEFFKENKPACLAFYGSTTTLAVSGLTFNGSKQSCTLGLLSLAASIATFSMLHKKFAVESEARQH